MISALKEMALPSISRRTLIRFLPTIVLVIISLIALSLLEFASLEPVAPSPTKQHKHKTGNRHKNMAAAGNNTLKFLTIPPRALHTATIIFSHGLGDTGDGWKPVARELASALPHAKWILPHAPMRPITVNYGMVMNGWSDVYSLGKIDAKEDEEGLLQSAAAIKELVKAENDAGISNNRIVLGGFSQGAALSVLTGLTTEPKYAGIAVLSGWFPIRQQLQKILNPNAASTPIFWGHGTDDQLVPHDLGVRSVQLLQESLQFKDVVFKSYTGVAHSADEQEIDDLSEWLAKVIP
ncbi:Acyl-protein thioesterase 1 [Ceratobasidium theobromae]|uniref:Acyl-protein thioesterase 1 n=1 Tax=Ceratobasidium theobromae TaxID=1582974 RepID=A0A5N5QVD8_9AGAM|nr:Acyl-protein thioesterase 1 [Ceratobasidium theobromae]